METVDYSEKLLKKFPGGKVLPLICPMVPFLDPGCRFFEHPKEHGYRIYHKTLEEHRQAMIEPLWHKRLNYETKWLTRRQLEDVSYEAIGRLATIKADLGVLPKSIAASIVRTIGETTELLSEMERALDRDGTLPGHLRNDIRLYNRKILAYSSDQIIPTHTVCAVRLLLPIVVIASVLSATSPDSSTEPSEETISIMSVPAIIASKAILICSFISFITNQL